MMDYSKLTIEELKTLAPIDSNAWYELVDRERRREETEHPELDPEDELEEEEPTQVWFTESPCGHCGYE